MVSVHYSQRKSQSVKDWEPRLSKLHIPGETPRLENIVENPQGSPKLEFIVEFHQIENSKNDSSVRIYRENFPDELQSRNLL